MRVLALMSIALFHGAAMESRSEARENPGADAAECTLMNQPSTKPMCRNVLPESWRNSNLKDIADRINKMVSGKYMPHERRSSVLCRSPLRILDSKNKKLSIIYRVPPDVNLFPSEPTGNSFLVVAVFDPVEDEGCSEALYKVRKARDEWTRVVSFMTVQTDKRMPAHDTTRNTTVTTWRSWAIAAKVVAPGDTEYRYEELNHGDFVSCAQHHAPGNNWAFIGCKGADTLSTYFKNNTKTFKSFDDMLDILNGDSPVGVSASESTTRAELRKTLLSVLRAAHVDMFVEAAWMRCGYLGCCAAQ